MYIYSLRRARNDCFNNVHSVVSWLKFQISKEIAPLPLSWAKPCLHELLSRHLISANCFLNRIVLTNHSLLYFWKRSDGSFCHQSFFLLPHNSCSCFNSNAFKKFLFHYPMSKFMR